MERLKKLELIQRSLGLRHKIKVHESLKHPETHEDLAIMLASKWELEDELRAIEELLAEARTRNSSLKKAQLLEDDSSREAEAAADEAQAARKSKAGQPKRRA